MPNLTQSVPYDFDELFEEARKILYESGDKERYEQVLNNWLLSKKS